MTEGKQIASVYGHRKKNDKNLKMEKTEIFLFQHNFETFNYNICNIQYIIYKNIEP